jgi:hypothetical protein
MTIDSGSLEESLTLLQANRKLAHARMINFMGIPKEYSTLKIEVDFTLLTSTVTLK